MSIKSISTHNQRNDEHLGFMTAIRTTLAKYSPTSIDLTNVLVAQFGDKVNNEDVSYKIVAKSSLTEEISKLDSASDSILVGFTTQIRAFMTHYDPAFQAAANRIMIVYNAFGDIRNKSYVAQTTDVVNFLQELKGKLNSDVVLLGLQGWVTRIEQANNEFMTVFNARQNEQASKNALTRLRTCRKETDEAYRAIVNRVNAGIAFNGETKYKTFVLDINTTIDYYNNLMAQRRGRAAAKKNTSDAEE
jgi:hypothetical protein